MIVTEDFYFNSFPSLNKVFPSKRGDILVYYNDLPVGKAINIPLAAYYRAMCRNAENTNRIYKITITYENGIKEKIVSQVQKSKSLF